MKKLFPYPEQRALEDAAFIRSVTPQRIHSLLLPIWSVTVAASVTEAQDYELIDRYLSRGIAEGGLRTTAELAEFFALEPILVDRALRALFAIGHLRHAGGVWTLTDLGLRSVRDQKRYVLTREDRRKLYFDAFGSRPLTRPYYDSNRITLLPLSAMETDRRFQALVALRPFDTRALAALATDPRRDLFNLPERIDNPREVEPPEQVLLPLYVVRGNGTDGRVHHLAYNQEVGEQEPYLSELVEQTPDLVALLATEERDAKVGDVEEGARRWFRSKGLDEYPSARTSGGLVQVVLPAKHFARGGKVPINQLGSFVMCGTGFFQLWCPDLTARRRALTTRVDTFLGGRSRVDRSALEVLVDAVARQLDLDVVDLADVRELAREFGHRSLVIQLDKLISP
ncbi:hypothetical protein [Actinokineospora sp. NBRC 105648]|uniref:hypothetical protein n=1 Tax=Actinokineospora sp. NBRC 105648 TaxID=3032206 RepID=UPI0024A5B534|nr:hypothetical protein [Actinokineospora sp. NBRC 105648]GLZ43296.1 hypothetical protein Acsp05_69200 [Actinokineospora sp. NBRC 105648]